MRTAEGAVPRFQERKCFVDILLGLRIPTSLLLAILEGTNAQKACKINSNGNKVGVIKVLLKYIMKNNKGAFTGFDRFSTSLNTTKLIF